MAVEKIRYKDLLDYAERLTFSGTESKVARGEYLMDLVNQIDKFRAEKGTDNELFLAKNEIEFIMDKGFKTEPFWAFLKNGKALEYGSPLTDYQEAYIKYMTNPAPQDKVTKDKNDKEKVITAEEIRADAFVELKETERGITEIGNRQYLQSMPLARGEAQAFNSTVKSNLKDISYVKQMAYGRNGLKGQLNATYESLAKIHDPAMIEKFRELEELINEKDCVTNNIQLYTTAKFVIGESGKEELHYTVNAPLINLKSPDEVKISNNEALTIKITNEGIQGAKYTDFNLYYDDLSVMAPVANGKMAEKTGKKAADYLKEHPNEDYPDPNRIQQIKVDVEKDGKMTKATKWVYVLPDMSYPEKGSLESFTKDFAGIHNSIVSGRLKEVSKEIEKMSLEQEKCKVIDFKSWSPKQHHVEKSKESYREAVR